MRLPVRLVPLLAVVLMALSSACGLELSGQGPVPADAGKDSPGTTATEGFVLTPPSGLVTREDGSTATFTVRLTAAPTADVTLPLSSGDPSEGKVSPEQLTFTAANWSAPQTVTVTGVNDDLADGPQVYAIITGAASSRDPRFAGADPPDVTVKNDDDDRAGFAVTPTAGLVTAEFGAQATFTVALTSQPKDTVSVALSSSNTAEGTVSPKSLTFTPTNWRVAQVVTVTGVDDMAADGPQTYRIVTAPAVSADPGYAGLDAEDVTVTNTDDETPGFTVVPTTGLRTTEAGGTATFTVRLDSQPTANVVVAVASSKTTEGNVSPTSLTFTTADWRTPRTVTVTGVNDDVDDDDQPFTVVLAAAASSDPKYNGLNPPDVSVTNADDDAAQVLVSPTSGLTTTEGGGTATFTVRLGSRPTANVTVALSSSNVGEGTVNPGSVTFTTSATSWSTPQTVTVTGVDDFADDGDVGFTIVTGNASSTDVKYAGLAVPDVAVTNVDNDTAGVSVSAISRHTRESGQTATFTIVLTSLPAANVTVPLSSSNTAEGTIAIPSVVFTPANWNVAQTVTVTGVDDKIDDGAVTYSIVTAAAVSTDARYSGVNGADVSVVNDDDDTAGVVVSPTSGLVTTEAGGSASFTVVLATQPTAPVTIPVSSSNAGEGLPDKASLVFTAANWNVAQTVTVTGVDDKVDDGDVGYSIVLAAPSGDLVYAAIDPADVLATNTDDDTAGIVVSPSTGLVTTEQGGTAVFTVVLTSQPTANVTIGVSTSDAGEGSLSIVDVTFTSANWNIPQAVTVKGVDDGTKDGDKAYRIITAAAASADTKYKSLKAADVDLVNWDDDTPGFRVTPTSGLVTTEAGGTATFTVALRSAPTDSVTFALESSNPLEGTIAVATLTFTPANWSIPQFVTVTGADDLVKDGDQAYAIKLATAASLDLNYDTLDPPDVSATNRDND